MLGVAHAQATVTKASFGKTAAGENVDLYTLRNANGVEAKITNYGGIVVSLKVPDRNGKFDDVVLGFNDLDSYLKGHPYFGALIGRYGNRIAKGRFTLNGVEYKLAVNNGENTLHGGIKGFDKVVWTGKEIENKSRAGGCPDLPQQGRRGRLSGKSQRHRVVYTLTNNNELKIEYSATTDKDTVTNLTHHSYFNLAGEGNGDILNHRVTINANRFLPTDAGSIPTGELRNVAGTPFDFLKATQSARGSIRTRSNSKLGNGYDHTWIINGRPGTLRLAAQLTNPPQVAGCKYGPPNPGCSFIRGTFWTER